MFHTEKKIQQQGRKVAIKSVLADREGQVLQNVITTDKKSLLSSLLILFRARMVDHQFKNRARICKRSRSPGIYLKESISSAYVAQDFQNNLWGLGTDRNRVVVRLHRLTSRYGNSVPTRFICTPQSSNVSTQTSHQRTNTT